METASPKIRPRCFGFTLNLIKKYLWLFLSLILGVVSSVLFYGLPNHKIDLGTFQDGAHLIQPVDQIDATKSALNLPKIISAYGIHLQFLSKDSCFNDPAIRAYLRVDASVISVFAQYAEKTFPKGSCVDTPMNMPPGTNNIEGTEFFCIKVNSPETYFDYPADQPLNFSTMLMGDNRSGRMHPCNESSDPLGTGMDAKNVHIFATPSLTAWSWNLVAVTILWLVVLSSVRGLLR